jgi:hypothetical protein
MNAEVRVAIEVVILRSLGGVSFSGCRHTTQEK